MGIQGVLIIEERRRMGVKGKDRGGERGGGEKGGEEGKSVKQRGKS